MPIAVKNFVHFNQAGAPLAAGVRAGPTTVGYLGNPASLPVLTPGGSTPSGTFWDGNALRITDNATLDGYYVDAPDGVFMTSTNPTIRNCVVEYVNSGVFLAGAGRGTLTIEDTTIFRGVPSGENNFVGAALASDSQILARRCHVSGASDGVAAVASNGGNALVSQCYIQTVQVDVDQHGDGIQLFADNGTDPGGGPVTFEHNYIDYPAEPVLEPMSSSVAVGESSNNSAPIIQPTINNNFFAGATYALRIQFRLSNVVVTNNDFGPVPSGAIGEVISDDPSVIVTWSNNRDSDGILIPQP